MALLQGGCGKARPPANPNGGTFMNRAWAPAMLAAAGLILSACGGSDATTTSTGASAGAPADPGVAAAKEYLASQQANPTTIELKDPLSKKPEAGKLAVKLVTPQ